LALSEKEEGELAVYIIEMEQRGVSISRKDVKYIAGSIDATHQHPVFEDGPTDGWLTSFLRRHHHLSLRRPSIVDGGRFAMARKSTVDAYFTGLKAVFTQFSIVSSERVYNLDETGFNREPK
jgi:hypothetical protein